MRSRIVWQKHNIFLHYFHLVNKLWARDSEGLMGKPELRAQAPHMDQPWPGPDLRHGWAWEGTWADSSGRSVFRVTVSLHHHNHPLRQQDRCCDSCTNKELEGESSWQTAQGHTGSWWQETEWGPLIPRQFNVLFSLFNCVYFLGLKLSFFFFPELIGFKATSYQPIPPVPPLSSWLRCLQRSLLLFEKIIVIIFSL